MQEQKKAQNPFGTPSTGIGGIKQKVVERKAPDSESILKELDTASKTSTETKKRRILERCGC